MRKLTLVALLAFILAAPAANAATMAVAFTGSNGSTPISGSFLYDSTLSLTNLGGGEWGTAFTGSAVLNGTPHSASLLVGIASNVTFCDSGASTCDFFFFDIYLDANDALGPSGPSDVNNDTLAIVDFELPTGTFTPGALPDFAIPNASMSFVFVEYATAGNASIDAFNEWTGDNFNTNATGSITPVPEPATILLLGSGLLGLAGFKRGRKQL